MPKKSTTKKPAAKPKSNPSPDSPTKTKPTKPKPNASRKIIGDHELGQHYGVDKKSVYNWRKDGMPGKKLPGNKWEYDLDETDPWVESRREIGELDDENKLIKKRTLEAKMRIVEAKAEEEERSNEIAERNVLDRTAIELKITEAIQAMRDGLLRIPTLFHSHLCRKCQPKKDELKKQIEHELTQLAKRLAGLGEEDDDD